ncbi:MAG TPA: hypothetical protein VHS03_05285 [Gaiellaceae bacterium]|jgi:hypothetical protein|nr:hypothetical protein [Gaiellaceae bacterium]
MTRAAVAVGLVVVALAAAGVAAGGTVTLGKGLPPWKLGQRYAVRSGLVRSQRFAANDGPGCVSSASSATRIDFYRGLRVAWRADSHGRLYLVDVATSRAGDRSADGFVVAVSTRGAVRLKHPGVTVSYAQGPLALGASSLAVIHHTGKETFDELVYWFDAQGTLTALEALAGGC